jgi:FKBP-type peptidyl-prolyl cis-trans isomerase (trigger factor)
MKKVLILICAVLMAVLSSCNANIEVKQDEENADISVEVGGNTIVTSTPTEEIVDDEAAHQLEDIKHQLSHRNMTLESYLEMINMTNDDLMSKLKEDALKNLKYAFTMMKIAEVEKITVSKEDLDKSYEDIAKMYGMGIDDVRKALGNREDGLKRDLLNQKVITFLKESNSL